MFDCSWIWVELMEMKLIIRSDFSLVSSCEYFPVVMIKTHVGVPHQTDYSHARFQMETLPLLTLLSVLTWNTSICVYTLKHLQYNKYFFLKMLQLNWQFSVKWFSHNTSEQYKNAQYLKNNIKKITSLPLLSCQSGVQYFPAFLTSQIRLCNEGSYCVW